MVLLWCRSERYASNCWCISTCNQSPMSVRTDDCMASALNLRSFMTYATLSTVSLIGWYCQYCRLLLLIMMMIIITVTMIMMSDIIKSLYMCYQLFWCWQYGQSLECLQSINQSISICISQPKPIVAKSIHKRVMSIFYSNNGEQLKPI